MKTVIIIPARYGSTRLPGKPLLPIRGVSMLERVWRIARQARGVTEVYVATDDVRILRHVEGFGGKAVMTSASARNGTERTLEAARSLPERPDVVVNLQGDAPLTPPHVAQAVVDRFAVDEEAEIVTPAVRMDGAALEALRASKERGEVSGTTVTFDVRGRALYFSKAIIPYLRERLEPLPVYRHIGLYGYRYETLERYVELPEGTLERAEGLEQLRALEHGIPVTVTVVEYAEGTHWGVDSAADVARVEQVLMERGEA